MKLDLFSSNLGQSKETKMKKVIAHHSVVDWDFTPGTNKILDTDIFVSPPSSLRLGYGAAPEHSHILCRVAETLCIAEGEVRTWRLYRTVDVLWYLTFRNQSALGTADFLNCYRWVGTWKTATLYRYNNGVPTGIGDGFDIEMVAGTWYHLRTIYWNGLNLEGTPALCIELYVEIDGQWVKQGNTLYDTVNEWKDSEINRSGIGGRNIGYYQNFDDTEIWGPV